MYKIRLELTSFDFFYLKKSINKCFEILLILGLNDYKYIGLPGIQKKYTLLRSPHIDKKSREQLEIRKHKYQLLINSEFSKITGLFLYILKNSEFYGVEIKITLFYSTQY